mgnify:CR=1 FL=1
MNRELLSLSRKKQKLYNKFLKSKTYINELKYKQCKRQFERQMQIAKKNHYSQLLEKYQSNLRKSWSIIKEVITHKTNRGSGLPSYLNVDGKEVISTYEMATSFNSYFANIGSALAQTIPASTQRHLSGKAMTSQIRQVSPRGLVT